MITEDNVRDHIIAMLIRDYGYSEELIVKEVSVTNSKRGRGSARADVVIWRSIEDKNNGFNPVIVVECKASHNTLTDADYYQGLNYATWAGALYFILTNHTELKVYKVFRDRMPNYLYPIDGIPTYESLLTDTSMNNSYIESSTTETLLSFPFYKTISTQLAKNNYIDIDDGAPDLAFYKKDLVRSFKDINDLAPNITYLYVSSLDTLIDIAHHSYVYDGIKVFPPWVILTYYGALFKGIDIITGPYTKEHISIELIMQGHCRSREKYSVYSINNYKVVGHSYVHTDDTWLYLEYRDITGMYEYNYCLYLYDLCEIPIDMDEKLKDYSRRNKKKYVDVRARVHKRLSEKKCYY